MIKNLPTMQETEVWSPGQEDPLEKEMATHSSIFAWRILWTEEPGMLQSLGSQRVRHNWVTNRMDLPKYSLVVQGLGLCALTAEGAGSIPGLGRSPGEGNGNPFQYSCLENSMDRGAWQATIHGVVNSWTRLNNSHFHFCSVYLCQIVVFLPPTPSLFSTQWYSGRTYLFFPLP